MTSQLKRRKDENKTYQGVNYELGGRRNDRSGGRKRDVTEEDNLPPPRLCGIWNVNDKVSVLDYRHNVPPRDGLKPC